MTKKLMPKRIAIQNNSHKTKKKKLPNTAVHYDLNGNKELIKLYQDIDKVFDKVRNIRERMFFNTRDAVAAAASTINDHPLSIDIYRLQIEADVAASQVISGLSTMQENLRSIGNVIGSDESDGDEDEG